MSLNIQKTFRKKTLHWIAHIPCYSVFDMTYTLYITRRYTKLNGKYGKKKLQNCEETAAEVVKFEHTVYVIFSWSKLKV